MPVSSELCVLLSRIVCGDNVLCQITRSFMQTFEFLVNNVFCSQECMAGRQLSLSNNGNTKLAFLIGPNKCLGDVGIVCFSGRSVLHSREGGLPGPLSVSQSHSVPSPSGVAQLLAGEEVPLPVALLITAQQQSRTRLGRVRKMQKRTFLQTSDLFLTCSCMSSSIVKYKAFVVIFLSNNVLE